MSHHQEVVEVAMTPEERRQRDRERQARHRAAKLAKPKLEALPQIGPGGHAARVTLGVTSGVTDADALSNEAAAVEFLAGLKVPVSAKPRAALLLTLARDLDSNAIAQRSALAQRYDETMEKLVAAAKPVERDELDEMRRSFYSGGIDGIDDDPEAPQRTVRKKA